MSGFGTIEMREFAKSELGLIVRSFGIGGVSHGKSQNGEAEEVANSVGREAVPQGRSGRILVNKSSARPAPTMPRRNPTIGRDCVGGNGPNIYTHTARHSR